MKDDEVIEYVYKYYEKTGCMKCAIVDAAAKQCGKVCGMCEECFNRSYVLINHGDLAELDEQNQLYNSDKCLWGRE